MKKWEIYITLNPEVKPRLQAYAKRYKLSYAEALLKLLDEAEAHEK